MWGNWGTKKLTRVTQIACHGIRTCLKLTQLQSLITELLCKHSHFYKNLKQNARKRTFMGRFSGQIRRHTGKLKVLSCLTRLSLFVWIFSQIIWIVIYFLPPHHHPLSPQHTQKHSVVEFSCCNWQHSCSLPDPNNFFPIPKSQDRSYTNNSSGLSRQSKI